MNPTLVVACLALVVCGAATWMMAARFKGPARPQLVLFACVICGAAVMFVGLTLALSAR